MVEQGELLPVEMPGHWDTLDGCHMASDQISKARTDLCKGDVSDLSLANLVFMASRNDLDLIVWQTAAKERIRWLSAQLALASTRHSTDFSRGLEAGAARVDQIRREVFCSGPDCTDYDHGRDEGLELALSAIRSLIPPVKP